MQIKFTATYFFSTKRHNLNFNKFFIQLYDKCQIQYNLILKFENVIIVIKIVESFRLTANYHHNLES